MDRASEMSTVVYEGIRSTAWHMGKSYHHEALKLVKLTISF